MNTFVRYKVALIRAISVILLLAVLSSIISGCEFIDGIQIKDNNLISEQEIARLIINSINDETVAPDCYSSIPEIQREEVSLALYLEYTDILRSVSGSKSNIT